MKNNIDMKVTQKNIDFIKLYVKTDFSFMKTNPFDAKIDTNVIENFISRPIIDLS